MRSALIVKKNKGEFVGKLAPYGYIKDSKDKHKFIIDKNVSRIIIKMYNMILDGKSRKDISDYLNKKEILTPSEYLKISTDKDIKVLKKWNPEMVNRILRNENYTGTLFQGKKRKLNYRVNKKIEIDKENWIITENHHEAIITKKDFDKVQVILDRKSKTNKDGTIDVFSGFLKCNNCGNKMTIKNSKNKIYYYCDEYYRNKKCENSESIEKDKLIELISNKLNLDKVTRLELENKVKYIYIGKDNNIKIEYK